MDELTDLYQEIILSHNKRPRNDGSLDPCTHKADGFNPLCGDKLTVFLRKPSESIEEVTCQTEGCAISRASGSIMTTMVKGKTAQEVEEIITGIKELLSGEEEPEVLPELGRVADRLRHDMRHLVQRDEHDRVHVDNILLRVARAQAAESDGLT